MSYQSKVTVNRKGRPVTGARVALKFSGGLTASGFTNSNGTVTIQHESRGAATIYVNGQECGKITNAPGVEVVEAK